MGERNTQQSILKLSDSCRRHPPATYISPQDRVALQTGKPTSWQYASDGLGSEYSGETSRFTKGKKNQQNNSTMDAQLLAELPPHYYPGNQ